MIAIDTNLTGAWNTMAAAVPHLIAVGGGPVIATSSTAGLKGMPLLAPYVAAKHAVAGICRSMASEPAGHRIRVSTVHPAGAGTPMAAGLEIPGRSSAEAPIAAGPGLRYGMD